MIFLSFSVLYSVYHYFCCNHDNLICVILFVILTFHMEGKRVFDGIKLFIMDVANVSGSLAIVKHFLGYGLLFAEKGKDLLAKLDFYENLILSPLFSPSDLSNGYYFFDLNYYREVTTMEGPPRFCLHDILQEPTISFNFESKEAVTEFVSYIQHQVTFAISSIPGFYNITRCYPPMCNVVLFEAVKDQLKFSLFKSSSANDLLLLEAQNALSKYITPKVIPHAAKQQVFNDIIQKKDRKLLVEFLKKNQLTKEMLYKAWNLTIGLPSFDDMNQKIVSKYKEIKEQFESLTESQLMRSSLFRKNIQLIQNEVKLAKNDLLRICNTEEIFYSSFSILMCISLIYDSLSDRCAELMRVMLTLFSIYIKNYQNNKTEKKIIIILPDNSKVDLQKVEIAVFWSLIFLFEKAELKKTILESETSLENNFSDLLFLVHPQLLKWLTQKKISNFVCVSPMLSMMFSTELDPMACCELWIHIGLSDSPYDYLLCILTCVIFLLFPNITNSTTGSNFIKLFLEAFKEPGIPYLTSAARQLLENRDNIIKHNFPTLFK